MGFYKYLTIFLLIIVSTVDCNIIHTIACKFYECCDEPYLLKNFTQLEDNFNKYLFGQPLVKETTINALKGHYTLAKQSKALVFSFHGLTGSGKNYVSQFIAGSMYKKGLESRFYKYFSSTRDFPHNEKLNEYREKIIKAIETTVEKCEYSLFVFDEMDKIPVGLMDTIKAYIDFNPEIGGYDYRKSVFLFLSNSASKEIAQKTLELDLKNVKRDKFELKVFQKAIQEHIYHHKSDNNKGMWHSTLISNHLIDHYVPFLPLEREHVKMCIKFEFKKFMIDEKTSKTFFSDVDLIADELVYEPTGYNKYSSSGCKRISNLVRKFIVEKRIVEESMKHSSEL